MNSDHEPNPSRSVAPNNPTLDQSRPDRGLRVILLVGFGGLLALLLYSGANALNTLRDLHATEEAARNRFLDRGRVLSTVILSANNYSDHMEAYLLSVNPNDVANIPEENATRQA